MISGKFVSRCLKKQHTSQLNGLKWCSNFRFGNDHETTRSPITKTIDGNLASRYKEFHDEDSEIIFDVEEERKKMADQTVNQKLLTVDEFEGLNLKRGVTGVFEIEDLVHLLKRDRAKDIFVCKIDPKFKYVDYICIATGKSTRHLLALAEFVKRTHKKKRLVSDSPVHVEGKTASDWMALDLGNIALHLFLNSTRKKYDLETLWAIGEKYDDHSNQPDDLILSMLESNSLFSDGAK